MDHRRARDLLRTVADHQERTREELQIHERRHLLSWALAALGSGLVALAHEAFGPNASPEPAIAQSGTALLWQLVYWVPVGIAATVVTSRVYRARSVEPRTPRRRSSALATIVGIFVGLYLGAALTVASIFLGATLHVGAVIVAGAVGSGARDRTMELAALYGFAAILLGSGLATYAQNSLGSLGAALGMTTAFGVVALTVRPRSA